MIHQMDADVLLRPIALGSSRQLFGLATVSEEDDINLPPARSIPAG